MKMFACGFGFACAVLFGVVGFGVCFNWLTVSGLVLSVLMCLSAGVAAWQDYYYIMED
jgi:hypothetical protein